MVAEHLKDKPYELRWRYDFYKDLTKVANIGENTYDTNNLREKDLKEIESEFGYLRNMETFYHVIGNDLSALVKEGVSYIDFVNEGCPNPDGKTYSFKQYWETSLGDILFDYEGNDASFSKEGLYQFENDTFPCYTKVIENGKIYADYVKGFFWADTKCPENELETAELPENHKRMLSGTIKKSSLEERIRTASRVKENLPREEKQSDKELCK